MYEVPPSVDDELVVTVRVRLDSPEVRDSIADVALGEVTGWVTGAIRPLLADRGVHLAGVEVALPDFKPYHYARTDPLPEVTP
jgi:hypothetical protein